MDNVERRIRLAGDSFSHHAGSKLLIGVVSIGCLMGQSLHQPTPFTLGNPGWKAMGGRIGYSAATGYYGDLIIVVWHHLVDGGIDSSGSDFADSALHRHADWRPSLSGNLQGVMLPAIILALPTPHVGPPGASYRLTNRLGSRGHKRGRTGG